MNSFDIDGVIFLSPTHGGVHPGPHDIIITGRSFEEEPETKRMLFARGIFNPVFYNRLTFNEKTRESSGLHKAKTINALLSAGRKLMCHFEDDEVQIAIIRKLCPTINVVHLVHDLTEKENVRHV